MIDKIAKQYQDIPDLIIKKIKLNLFLHVYLVFIESLCSQDKINNYILKYFDDHQNINISKIPGANVKQITENEISTYLYNGYILLIKRNTIYAIEVKLDLQRSISTNEIEPSIKGPKLSFVENYQTNIGLIKKKIKNNYLKSKELNLGNISNTKVGILYIEKNVDKNLLEKVSNKLSAISKDVINDVEDLSYYLSSSSIFPTVVTTERPDRCVDALVKGKIVILADNSSSALILPTKVLDFINPYTDIYLKKKNSYITKIIRFLCFILSSTVPAFYIAIVNYNQEAIPTSLIINFQAQRQGVPFPAIIECSIMLIICEILRESDLRFPSKYGSAISILGALVLGDAAVSAGLVSPIMIIIASFTYISSLIFTEIELSNALRTLRFAFLLLSAFYGLYGLVISNIFLIIYLVSSYEKTNLLKGA